MISGEIIEVEQTRDTQKNIVIWVCFTTDDGSEIPFHQGAELLERDRKKVWPLYARFENFLGKTPEMIQEWVRINVEAQIGIIIREIVCKDILNAEMITAVKKMIGTRFSLDKVFISVDIPVTGVGNAVIELSSDSTYKRSE